MLISKLITRGIPKRIFGFQSFGFSNAVTTDIPPLPDSLNISEVNENDHFDIIIVGGGLVGTTTACLLGIFVNYFGELLPMWPIHN